MSESITFIDGLAYKGAGLLWQSLQKGITKFVVDHDGDAHILPYYFKAVLLG